MVEFACQCGRQLQAREESAGQRTRCPECGRELLIPGASPAVSPLTPSPPAAGRPPPWPAREEVLALGGDPVSGERTATSRKAIASLILGVLSFPCNALAGIPAILLGIFGLRDIHRIDGAAHEIQPDSVALGLDPALGGVVDERPDLAEAPAQLAARIVGHLPQQIAQLAARDGIRREREISEKRAHLA